MTTKQDKLVNMLNNPYIDTFISEANLSSSFVVDHYNVFESSFDSICLCKGCNGLNECKQGKEGEMLTLAYDGGVYNDITYCPYYVAKLNKEKTLSNFVRNDIPSNYSDVNLNNIELLDAEIENLCALCFDILDKKTNKGLYIYGDLGVGKTYMCIALANSLAKNGEKVGFVKSNYFINDMRKLIGTNNDLYEKTFNSIKKVPYLFIDDIGSESVSTYSRDDLLLNILDYRMENKLCTIFTSNLSKESLLKHYTYDKNDNSSIVRAKRLLERIDILSNDFVLNGNNKRRG